MDEKDRNPIAEALPKVTPPQEWPNPPEAGKVASKRYPLELKLSVEIVNQIAPEDNIVARVFYPDEGGKILVRKGLNTAEIRNALCHEIGHVVDFYINGEHHSTNKETRENNASVIGEILEIAALKDEVERLKRKVVTTKFWEDMSHKEASRKIDAWKEIAALEKENRRLERDLNLMAQGNFPEHESLKLDIWAEYMARETSYCTIAYGGIEPEYCEKPISNEHCVPCWQRFAHGE